MPIQISYLADYPAWVARFGNWYRDEWESIWEPNTFSGWFDVGVGHANYSSLPLGFVAHRDGKLLGAAGLDPEALAPELQHFAGPWMTGLFAEQIERRKDIRNMLSRQILETAKHFGHQRIYTMCRVTDASYNFEGKSWSQEDALVLSGREIFVLSMDLN